MLAKEKSELNQIVFVMCLQWWKGHNDNIDNVDWKIPPFAFQPFLFFFFLFSISWADFRLFCFIICLPVLAASPSNKEARVSLRDIVRVSDLWIWRAREIFKFISNVPNKCSSSSGSFFLAWVGGLSVLPSGFHKANSKRFYFTCTYDVFCAHVYSNALTTPNRNQLTKLNKFPESQLTETVRPGTYMFLHLVQGGFKVSPGFIWISLYTQKKIVPWK